jgi:lipopolysaccharide export system permease protein
MNRNYSLQMIFQRALRTELVSTAGAVFTTLFTITITNMLIRILGQAAGGKVASADVVALIGFSALNYLPQILILTGFISVLMVVARSYQDSEMVVWFASGMSLTRWIRPVLGFGLPIVLLTGVLSFGLTPWAAQQSADFKERFEKREDIARVSPGKFQESSAANRVFFVEGVSGDATKVQNVFVNSMANGRTSVVVAKEGSIETNARGDKVLVMEKGRRYDGVPNQSDFEMMEFEKYSVMVARQSEGAAAEKSASALSTSALLADMNRVNAGELLWRAALPIMALMLMLLAIPLSFVNPRGGRSANLLIALLMFVAYTNITSVFQVAVSQGRMPFALAVWPLHAIAALLVAFLFVWRLNMNSRLHPGVWLGAWRRSLTTRRGVAR